MQVAHPLTGVAVRGDGDDLEVRVRRDQAQQLPARVAAGTGDGDPRTHVHEYAVRRNFIQRQGSRLLAVTAVGVVDAVRKALVVDAVRAACARSRPARAPRMQAYMKSAMPFLGVPLPGVRAVVRDAVAACPPASASDLRREVESLWDGAAFREERYAATALLTTPAGRRFVDTSFLPLYERLIVAGAWWDHTDELARRVGELLRRDPAAVRPEVRAWQTSPDRWLRRVSVICQLGFRDDTDRTLLAEAIEANLSEADFFLRKAIGWALRDLARTDPCLGADLRRHPSRAEPAVGARGDETPVGLLVRSDPPAQ